MMVSYSIKACEKNAKANDRWQETCHPIRSTVFPQSAKEHIVVGSVPGLALRILFRRGAGSALAFALEESHLNTLKFAQHALAILERCDWQLSFRLWPIEFPLCYQRGVN
jgi:hypothetical protein